MTDQDRSFLFLLGSSRRDGNTETLARRAAAALPAEVCQDWQRLAELPMAEFTDLRHGPQRWSDAPAGTEATLLASTLAATDLVVASPVYWYSVTAQVKRYLDYWSRWLVLPEARFRDQMRGKTLWLVTVLGEPAHQAQPMIDMLRKAADYLDMRWGGVLLGNGTRPGDVLTDTAAIAEAECFFTPVLAG